MSVTADLKVLVLRELATCRREVELFPDDESLWKVLPGVSNSAGNLALHLAGNLRHFVGGVLGGSGYARDRDAEFGSRGLSRAAVVATLIDAELQVGKALDALDESVLAEPYPAPPKGVEVTTRRWLMHLASHAAFHVGQMGYLRRILTRNPATADAVSVIALNAP